MNIIINVYFVHLIMAFLIIFTFELISSSIIYSYVTNINIDGEDISSEYTFIAKYDDQGLTTDIINSPGFPLCPN